jgi:hypothetical protein
MFFIVFHAIDSRHKFNPDIRCRGRHANFTFRLFLFLLGDKSFSARRAHPGTGPSFLGREAAKYK